MDFSLSVYLSITFGLLTFALMQVITLSQFFRAAKTKNTSGVPALAYVLLLASCLLALVWGFGYYYQIVFSSKTDPNNIWLFQWTIIPIISYYIIDFFIGTALLSNKLYHLHLCKKKRMNEVELSYYLLKKQRHEYLKSGSKFYKKKYFKHALFLITIYVLTTIGIYFLVTRSIPRASEQMVTDGWWWVLVANFISAISNEILGWPTFVSAAKKKDTSGVSLSWAIVFPIACTVSFIYAFLLAWMELENGSTPWPPTSFLTLPSTFGAIIFSGLIPNYGLLIAKLVNIARARKKHLDEIAYTKKYVIPAYEKKLKAKARKSK